MPSRLSRYLVWQITVSMGIRLNPTPSAGLESAICHIVNLVQLHSHLLIKKRGTRLEVINVRRNVKMSSTDDAVVKLKSGTWVCRPVCLKHNLIINCFIEMPYERLFSFPLCNVSLVVLIYLWEDF